MAAAEETFHTDIDALKDNERALVLMDAWGAGVDIDREPFQDHCYVIRDWAPCWVQLPKGHEGVVTLLSVQIGRLCDFEGYRLFGSYSVTEKVCPYLDSKNHSDSCMICQGDRFIHWGDDWRLVVLLKEKGSDPPISG